MKIRIFAGVLFLLGASILLYPSVSAYLNSQNQAKVVEDYSNQVKQMNDAETEKELQKAREFNENLKRTVVIDPFTEEMNQQLSEEYLKILNKNNGQIGTLIIPKIQLKLPVYHGTEAKVLKKGVGHIQNTAFPVGGGGTHAVLSAHRGLPEARLFTDLDKLEKGDMFFIQVLDETLAYEVDQIKTVLPEDTGDLQPSEEQDYVTLVTCTPYGVNTHRLLVRGKRVPYDQKVQKTWKDWNQKDTADNRKNKILIAIVVVEAVIFFYYLLIRPVVKYRKEKRHEK